MCFIITVSFCVAFVIGSLISLYQLLPARLVVKARTCEAKAKAKDLTLEAKAKDFTFEAKAEAKAEDLTSEVKAKKLNLRLTLSPGLCIHMSRCMLKQVSKVVWNRCLVLPVKSHLLQSLITWFSILPRPKT